MEQKIKNNQDATASNMNKTTIALTKINDEIDRINGNIYELGIKTQENFDKFLEQKKIDEE